MENRKTLHDYSLVIILLALLSAFLFTGTMVAALINGSIDRLIASIDPSMVLATKIGLGVYAGLEICLILSQVIIGCKGLNVCQKPTSDKGYIVAAKIFFVLATLTAISAIFAIVGAKNGYVIDTILSFVSAALDVVIYGMFIKAATAVRRDAIAEMK